MSNPNDAMFQRIYERMLKDERFRCTCDESFREDSFHQAVGHYNHCMLSQVCRAIRLTHKEMISWE